MFKKFGTNLIKSHNIRLCLYMYIIYYKVGVDRYIVKTILLVFFFLILIKKGLIAMY